METILDAVHAAERVTEQSHGREPAICELTCPNCADGMRFDQLRCETCGHNNPRYAGPPALTRLNVVNHPAVRYAHAAD